MQNAHRQRNVQLRLHSSSIRTSVLLSTVVNRAERPELPTAAHCLLRASYVMQCMPLTALCMQHCSDLTKTTFVTLFCCLCRQQEAQLSQRGRAMPRVVEYFSQSLKAALSRNINMVTFANLGSVLLPSLKFVGLRVRKIRRIQCVSCLSTTVSQLFEPQLQKIVIFTYPGLHFLFAVGTPLRQSRKTLHE